MSLIAGSDADDEALRTLQTPGNTIEVSADGRINPAD